MVSIPLTVVVETGLPSNEIFYIVDRDMGCMIVLSNITRRGGFQALVNRSHIHTIRGFAVAVASCVIMFEANSGRLNGGGRCGLNEASSTSSIDKTAGAKSG